MWLSSPASYSLAKSEMYSIREFSIFDILFQVTSGQITSLSGHFRSPEVTWRHLLSLTASSCELQPCRKWNIQYTPVFVLPQPLPGHFRSNDATSGSLPVTWGHVKSLPVTWRPPPASYSLVGSEIYIRRQFSAFYSHFQVTSGKITPLAGHFRSPGVTWRHFLSPDCHLLQVTTL